MMKIGEQSIMEGQTARGKAGAGTITEQNLIESVNQNIMERHLTSGKEGADNINEQSMESGDMLIMEGHPASGQEESDIEKR